MDYKDTLNLPRTEFPMRAGLATSEPRRVVAWEESKLFERILENRADAPKFVFHDGPPYANGRLHLGHVLNKVLKDFVVKSRTMAGYRVDYMPGWDCHGLPIELAAEKELKQKHGEKIPTPLEIIEFCGDYARRFVDIQRKEFRRLGVLGKWDTPYLTLDPAYEANILRRLADLTEKGYLYRGLRPVHWSPGARTALADAEIEYNDRTDPSVYVRFPWPDAAEYLAGKGIEVPAGANVSVMIWTTTPWTLPANKAICVHPDFEYAVIERRSDRAVECLVLAKELAEAVRTAGDAAGGDDDDETPAPQWNELGTLRGADLAGATPLHPWRLLENGNPQPAPIITGEHVTLETGTGCVHTAPGHGMDDFIVGNANNLEVFSPVDAEGKFTEGVRKEWRGRVVIECNNDIVEFLRTKCEVYSGVPALFHTEKIRHPYPHDWRLHEPIIFRATEQWFVRLDHDDLRQKALEEIDKVNWVPKWGRDRIYNMVEGRPDWCISRQRVWGVPIAAVVCKKCGTVTADADWQRHVADLFEKAGGLAIWHDRPAAELLPDGAKCPECGGTDFDKDDNVLDVWFDSGVSWSAAVESMLGEEIPVDLYLEGSDQHRGWFHSSLLAAVGIRDKAPYKAVLTHGFVVDGDGRKMSKTLGNGIEPQKIWDASGAEILRLWVAAEDYREDIRVSDEIFKQCGDSYRRWRNTFRFLLGNLSDFTPDEDMVDYDDRRLIDRYILSRLAQLIDRCLKAYEDYNFHIAYHAINNFCVNDLSAFYLDILKDTLYVSAADAPDRRGSQSSMYEITEALLALTAPLIAFTADEAWGFLPKRKGAPDSIHLCDFPAVDERWRADDEALESAGWELLASEVRPFVYRVLEQARGEKRIGKGLEAKVLIHSGDERTQAFLKEHEAELPMLFIVSQVNVTDSPPEAGNPEDEGAATKLTVLVESPEGGKCKRCWNVRTDVGGDDEHPELCVRCCEAVAAGGGAS